MNDLIKRMKVSERDVGEAATFALQEIDDLKEAKEKEIRQQEDIAAQEYVESEEIIDQNSRIEDILNSLEEVEPGTKEKVFDHIIGRHYGIKPKKKKNNDLVKYSSIEEKLKETNPQVDSLQAKIKQYLEATPYVKDELKNLKWLAEASAIDTTTADIYLGSLAQVNKCLGKKYLKDEKEEALVVDNRIKGYGFAVYNAVIVATSIIFTPYLLLFIAGNMPGIMFSDFTLRSPDSNRYREKLFKHLQTKCNDLETNLSISESYTKKLLSQAEQVEHTSLELSYSNSLAVSSRRQKAIAYLKSSIERLEKISQL